jgi:ribosome-binding protein aMBF1 (putative translation factor)
VTTSATVLAPCGVCGRDVAATSLRDYIVAQGTVLKVCPTCYVRLLGTVRK